MHKKSKTFKGGTNFVLAKVAQIATTTCGTIFVLPVSGIIWTTSAKDITYIISLALVVQIVPLTGKTKLVAQVVVASCATCWQNEVSGTSGCR